VLLQRNQSDGAATVVLKWYVNWHMTNPLSETWMMMIVMMMMIDTSRKEKAFLFGSKIPVPERDI